MANGEREENGMTVDLDDHTASCANWPPNVTVRETTLTRQPVAECSRCEFVSAYWDCPCDLIHQCHTDLWACRDCYTEYHYAMETERTDGRSLFDNYPNGWQLSDNTCSNHNGTDEEPCEHCSQSGYENGIREFSWDRCDGCGSGLGGDRHRLAYWPKG